MSWAGGGEGGRETPCGEQLVILVILRRGRRSPGEEPGHQASTADPVTHWLWHWAIHFPCWPQPASGSEEGRPRQRSPSPGGPGSRHCPLCFLCPGLRGGVLGLPFPKPNSSSLWPPARLSRAKYGEKSQGSHQWRLKQQLVTLGSPRQGRQHKLPEHPEKRPTEPPALMRAGRDSTDPLNPTLR